MTYQFTKEQAIDIANAVSGSPLTCETLAAALAEFAPDYAYSSMIHGRREVTRVTLEDGREFASILKLRAAYPDAVVVILDGSYTFAKLPRSNSNGIVQSDSMTDEPFASFGIGGMVYC